MNYIAITLGPICRMTGNVRSIKALWASSYFFSYLAKSIIAPFKNREFILPIVNDVDLWCGQDGIGRFPDRYIFESQPGDFELLKKQIANILKYLANNISLSLNRKEQEDDIYVYINNFLKIYFFEKDCEISTVLNECYPILDLLEMQDSYNLKEKEDYFIRFFESKELYTSFLVKDAFNEIERFNSIDRIAEAEKIDGLIKENMAYHKYIAIVSADGDRMSNAIQQLLSEGCPITKLSKKLLSFGNDAINIIEKYGARIIFLGGDDILIFSPVKYGQKTVFDLVDDLSRMFDQQMAGFLNPPTLSFGVSITYNKFPMGEALDLSRHLLERAKNDKIHFSKNTVAYCLQKHSGQSSSVDFEKNKSSYRFFLNLLKEYTDQNTNLLRSVTHWLGYNEIVLSVILKERRLDRKERLKNYFDNSFNEDIHDSMRLFFNLLIDCLLLIYEEIVEVDENNISNEKKAINTLYSILRFIHFIKTKKDE